MLLNLSYLSITFQILVANNEEEWGQVSSPYLSYLLIIVFISFCWFFKFDGVICVVVYNIANIFWAFGRMIQSRKVM
jgi:hypothetical protein